jgi:hypothetical protein
VQQHRWLDHSGTDHFELAGWAMKTALLFIAALALLALPCWAVNPTIVNSCQTSNVAGLTNTVVVSCPTLTIGNLMWCRGSQVSNSNYLTMSIASSSGISFTPIASNIPNPDRNINTERWQGTILSTSDTITITLSGTPTTSDSNICYQLANATYDTSCYGTSTGSTGTSLGCTTPGTTLTLAGTDVVLVSVDVSAQAYTFSILPIAYTIDHAVNSTDSNANLSLGVTASAAGLTGTTTPVFTSSAGAYWTVIADAFKAAGGGGAGAPPPGPSVFVVH